jgi:hypothetical protein
MLKDRVFADGWPVAFLCSFECVCGGGRQGSCDECTHRHPVE